MNDLEMLAAMEQSMNALYDKVDATDKGAPVDRETVQAIQKLLSFTMGLSAGYARRLEDKDPGVLETVSRAWLSQLRWEFVSLGIAHDEALASTGKCPICEGRAHVQRMIDAQQG